MSKKGAAGPEFNKEHAHCFFRCEGGLFTMNLFLLTLRSTLTSAVMFWDSCEKMCNEKDQNFGATTTGSFFTTTRPPTCPWKPQSLWLTSNVGIIHHPPYSPDIAPCDFSLFPNLKMKLKGWCFETVSDIQRKSQAVLDSIKENDFHGAFVVWKKWWITVYAPKETILKEMAAKIE
jgi:hypothetical protein